MIDHPNARLAQQAWEAVADADVETLQALWSPDIVWHVTAENRWHGDHCGFEAVLEYLAQVGESGDTYESALDDILVSNDRVGMVCSIKTRLGARELETSYLLFCRIQDGQMVEIWTLPFDPADVNAFWKKPTSEPLVAPVG